MAYKVGERREPESREFRPSAGCVLLRSAAPDPCGGAIIWGGCPALGSGAAAAAARIPQSAGCTNYSSTMQCLLCVSGGTPSAVAPGLRANPLPTRRALSGCPGLWTPHPRSLVQCRGGGNFPVSLPTKIKALQNNCQLQATLQQQLEIRIFPNKFESLFQFMKTPRTLQNYIQIDIGLVVVNCAYPIFGEMY